MNDLNAGLTQLLEDGTHTGIYGLGRIAQVNGVDIQYFLGDQLSSVRQLANVSGDITLAKSYDPFGNENASIGSAQTMYGFDGEQMDSYIKLINLRSRLYDPSSGRFLTRDSWQGNHNSPLSLNRWIFVEGNPINHVDPSGQYASEYLDFSYESDYDKKIYKNSNWGDPDEQALDNAARSVGIALANVINNILIPEYSTIPYKGISWLPSMTRSVTPVEAFKQVYGGKVNLLRIPVNNDTPEKNNQGAWAYTRNAQLIWIYLNAEASDLYNPVYSRWLTHELGHAFESAVNSAFSPNFNNDIYVRSFLFGDDVCSIDPDLVRLPTNLRNNCRGLHSSNYYERGGDWQFNSSTAPEEIFADMFVAWTYDNPNGERGWATYPDGSLTDEAKQMSNVMNTDMPIFINVARWSSYNKGLWK